MQVLQCLYLCICLQTLMVTCDYEVSLVFIRVFIHSFCYGENENEKRVYKEEEMSSGGGGESEMEDG